MAEEVKDENIEEQQTTEEETKAEAEEQRYKALFEELQAEVADKQREALGTKKETLLTEAGYAPDQVERYAKYLTGESDGEIQSELAKLKADFPPRKRYADPSARGNGYRQKVKKEDAGGKGRELFQRLKGKGRVRRK